jgi:hypothetical protein
VSPALRTKRATQIRTQSADSFRQNRKGEWYAPCTIVSSSFSRIFQKSRLPVRTRRRIAFCYHREPPAQKGRPLRAGQRATDVEMNTLPSRFDLPPTLKRDDGGIRRVGFELEFSGIDLDATAAALQASLGASLKSETAAERVLQVESLGDFHVELDWAFLKNQAAKQGRSAMQEEWLERLGEAAALVVPVEVVCPPVPVDDLAMLDPMVHALREAGAVGTEESLLAAYGVHVNAEVAALEAATLYPIIRAYCLLQWWLVERHGVDPTRKMSPYIGLYPAAYVKHILSAPTAEVGDILHTYLEHNATRNRALDLLPLLSEIDGARVRSVVDDPRVQARPAFHYRLPDCHIEQDDWSLSRAWNTWSVVEKVAERADDLDALAREFLEADRMLLGVNRSRWVETLDKWLRNRSLV